MNHFPEKSPVGMYAWGGPGTIALLKEKYPQPQIDTDSYEKIYTEEYIKKAKEEFGLTHMWVTYSWGFVSEKKQDHYSYIRNKLPIFKKNGIKTIGYIQGLNVVTEDFSDQDIFCRGPKGQLLPYSRNRHLICPNNPNAQAVVEKRARSAASEGFDGIYMDNILFGISPIFVTNKMIPAFGCYCKYCKEKFLKDYGCPMPKNDFTRKQDITNILDFRTRSTNAFVKKISEIAHNANKSFGVNMFDPFHHNAEIFFGFDHDEIAKHVDYHLFENHAITKENKIDNSQLINLIKETNKPVFVLSYKDGIGIDESYDSEIIDAIFSESQDMHYSPCLKASEFKTESVWHALRISDIKKPKISKEYKSVPKETRKKSLPKHNFLHDILAKTLNPLYPQITNFLYHNANNFIHTRNVYTKAVKKYQLYDISIWKNKP